MIITLEFFWDSCIGRRPASCGSFVFTFHVSHPYNNTGVTSRRKLYSYQVYILILNVFRFHERCPCFLCSVGNVSASSSCWGDVRAKICLLLYFKEFVVINILMLILHTSVFVLLILRPVLDANLTILVGFICIIM